MATHPLEVQAGPDASDHVARLQKALDESEERFELLQHELDETNRGVVALYAELDDQAEQLRLASQQSESKFRTIYAQATSGIALVDAEGRISDANPALAAILGAPPDRLIGMYLSEFASQEGLLLLNHLASHTGTSLQRQQVPVRRPNGETVHVEWSVTPHIEPGVTMLVATDVSQRFELEQLRINWLDRERAARSDAEHGNRMKDDFVAVLAHELRTPLNAIVGWMQVLKATGAAQLPKALVAIERNGAIQARMIADLLDMSRLRLGKLAMTFEDIDPEPEVVAAVAALRPAFEDKGIEVAVTAAVGLRPIHADASRLQQVIWNLLTNAIKFSPRGSVVRVDIAEDRAGLRVRVCDAGQGIAPEFLAQVFDRFAQSDALVSNRQRGGLGLGLAIVKQVVEAHGGTIAVTSAGLGKGATFEVHLPFIAKAQVDVEAETRDDGLPLADLDILLVDDDQDSTAVLAVILRDRGAQVRAADDADAALAQIAARRPDLLVSDIGMPGKDGYELLRELRSMDAASGASHLPAIALTSFSREKDRIQALAAGFDAHCSKPLRPIEIVRQVRLLVDKAAQPRAPSPRKSD